MAGMEPMKSTTRIAGDDGSSHRARILTIARLPTPARTAVVVELSSAAGTAEAKAHRAAVLAVLTRIAALPGASLADCYCSARPLRDLPIDERRTMPDQADADPETQRRSIARQLAKVGRAAGAKGSGNPTRAVVFVIHLPGWWSPEHAAAFVIQPHWQLVGQDERRQLGLFAGAGAGK